MYLDGELTDRDLHDFESHVGSCDDCADALEEETAFYKQMRQHLAAPPASDMLRKRIDSALDAEDAANAKAARRERWNNWALPGVSMVAAAAALVFFVTDTMTSPEAADASGDEVAAVTVQKRDFAPTPAPTPTRVRTRQPVEPTPVLEVPHIPDSYAAADERLIQRAAREYTGVPLLLPQFSNVDATLVGFEPTELSDRRAAMFKYEVRVDGKTYLMALYALYAGDLDLRAKQSVTVGQRELSVLEHASRRAIALRTQNIGYVFVSNMDQDALIDVIANCGLLPK